LLQRVAGYGCGDESATGHAAERKWQQERFQNGACISRHLFFALQQWTMRHLRLKALHGSLEFSFRAKRKLCAKQKGELRQMKRKASTGVSHMHGENIH